MENATTRMGVLVSAVIGVFVLLWESIALVSPAAASSETPARLVLEAEGGPVWQTTNDVQIPNDDSATRFSLVDVAGKGSWAAGRLYATWNIGERHGIRFLLAPLRIKETDLLPGAIGFAGASFVEGEPVEATYKFNSWRASYRYRFHAGQRWAWWIGFTAKIRDAKVRLDQGAVAAEKTDVGFVPLLHLAGNWRFAERWRAELDVDALAGGPGRAEDASLKLRYLARDRWSVAAGYRTVEGGADVDAVYNFAWLHYAVASVAVSF